MTQTTHSHNRHFGVVGYAECTTSPATHATPTVETYVPFDTFYDSAQGTIGGMPVGMGLTYSGGIFTLDEDGIWIVNLAVEVAAAPGSTGRLLLNVPNYGYSPSLRVLAAANPTPWQVERTVVGFAGDTFSLIQSSTGSAVVIVDGYAVMDIIRIAGGLL